LAIDATEEAVGAITDRQYEMRHNDKSDRMMKMRVQRGMTEEKLTRCKEKYNNAKRKVLSVKIHSNS
jgi:ribosomal protein S12